MAMENYSDTISNRTRDLICVCVSGAYLYYVLILLPDDGVVKKAETCII